MKYLRQFGIIITIAFLGEIIHSCIPLPIPAGIYGIILLFLGLETGILKLSSVKEVSSFLIETMPIMFVPPAVALLESWGLVKDNLLVYVFIAMFTTIIVMGGTGKITQFILKRIGKGEEKDE